MFTLPFPRLLKKLHIFHLNSSVLMYLDKQRLVKFAMESEKEKKLTRMRLVQSTTTSLKLRAINMQISYKQALRPILALEVSLKRISSSLTHAIF